MMEGRLGRYDLLERLATGGMAELFLARASAKHGFEKTVVLKRILPAFAEQEDFIRMFMAEAQLAASLHHPNIAQVFDFGEDDGRFFFTMEYVAGLNLRQLLAASRKESASLPLGCALHIIVGVAAGLHHAHEHRDADNKPLQIVHRDVSPSNVIVTYEGNVKLVDFGIAKVAALGPATLTGSLKGKIAYMSPEQCRGELVDRRSDIFSLGTLLWELTTGRKLFSSNSNDLALLQKVERAEITPPSMVVPNYPSELEAIVLKAMARDRDKRFKTTLELRMAIEEFAHTYRVPLTSTRVSSYMDAVFPRPERRVVPMTSSIPSLRSGSPNGGVPLQLASVPTAQLSAGPARTVVAAHPNEVVHEPPTPPPTAEEATGQQALDDREITATSAPRGERKPFPVWIGAAAAAVILLGVGGYVMASNAGGDDEGAVAQAAARPEAPDPKAEPTAEEAAEEAVDEAPPNPRPARADAPGPVALAEPDVPPEPGASVGDGPDPVIEVEEDVEAAGEDEDKAASPAPPVQPEVASETRPKRGKSKRRRKDPAPAESAPAAATGNPEPAATPKSPVKHNSEGVFLPSRKKKPADPKPGRRKPSAKDFL